jgi:3-methyladenine DNA glycosylase/8-oxoguanine DNA glycosylase
LRIVETLFPTILEQKITSQEARKSFRGLTRRFGEPAPGPGDLRLQPSPERLAALPYWAFHPFGIARTRAETIRRVCARAARIEEASNLSPADAARRLRSLPGVGPWTVAHVAWAALGDADAVVVGDFHLPHALTWALAGEERGTDERMLELLADFPGHRGRVMRLVASAGLRPPARTSRLRLHHIEAH